MNNNHFFDKDIELLSQALRSVSDEEFKQLISLSQEIITSGKKIVISGLGKNLPVCRKFVSTMNALGFDCRALNASNALHGDMGMIRDGDMLIVLSKSGETKEIISMLKALENRNVTTFLITFSSDSTLAKSIDNKICIDLAHEGDLWNVIPNNSTVINLIILQKLSVELATMNNLSFKNDFLPNHPGGAIGEKYNNEK